MAEFQLFQNGRGRWEKKRMIDVKSMRLLFLEKVFNGHLFFPLRDEKPEKVQV